MNDYAELRAAAEAATPGPWTQGESAAGLSCVWVGGKSEPIRDMGPDCSWIDCNTEQNARYIAAANPEAIRALLAERDAMKATLEEALIWHEAQDKAISKQPNANTGHKGWMRAQHQEQAALIRAALAQEQS